MPEGDTIFRTARTLHRAFAGTTISGFETAYAQLASVDDNTPILNRMVEKVEARGKWLLIYFSGDLILTMHMLMRGSWHLYRLGEKWHRGRTHMRIVLRNDRFEAVGFEIPIANFHTARALERNSAIPNLGPDLLKSDFAANAAKVRIRAHTEEEVGNVLLNQQVMAGIGNVYKSEICFLCGINPFRPVASLGENEIACLVDQAQRLLAANVKEEAGDQIITYTGMRRTTHNADPTARVWVYRRKDRPCRRCGTPIRMQRQGIGARSTYWCPDCQH